MVWQVKGPGLCLEVVPRPDVRMTPLIMRTTSCNALLALACGVFVIPGHVFGSSYDPSTVLVLINDLYPAEDGTNGMGASQFVGQHYAQLRQIPAANVVHLKIPLSVMHPVGTAPTYDFMYYADYKKYLQTSVQAYMAQQGITDKILYIVPTYGIPYMLFDGLPGDPKTWRISLDSILAGMNSNRTSPFLSNPYYTASPSTTPAHFRDWKNPGAWKMYIVTRLDGPSAIIAAGLVDKAVAAENNPLLKTSGTGYYDWGGGTNPPDNSFKNARDLSVAQNIPSVLNNQLVTQAWFAPASTYAYTANSVSIFSQGISTVTTRFTVPEVSSGTFYISLNVLDDYTYKKIGQSWYRIYSANHRSYWELQYSFNGAGLFRKVVNGDTAGSCPFAVASVYPVDTKEIMFTFGDGGGGVFKNGVSLCSFLDAANNRFSMTEAEMVFRDMSFNLTSIQVQDSNSRSLWNDSFGSDTTGKYEWVTMPKQAQNALFIWGWYSGVHDAYSVVEGAIGAQLTSYTANAIRGGGAPEKDPLWVPYFLRLGITASWGPTGEPFVSGFALGDNLFGHFWRGYNFGESSYLANPYLNWMMIFIGDPLYAPVVFGSGVPSPEINSPTTAVGTLGKAFSYQIKTVAGDATSYGATGLPSGLTIDTKTGLISGTLGVSGVFKVTLTATNSVGTGIATLTIGPPRIHGSSPNRQPGSLGRPDR